jgi:cytochrome c peroxidase
MRGPHQRARRGAATVSVAALVAVATAGCAGRPAMPDVPDPALERVRTTALAGLDTLEGRLARLDSAAGRLAADAEGLAAAQAALIEARLAYKRVEYALETFAPTAARGLNGPPIPEVEEDEGDRPMREPEGLQVAEEHLWGDDPVADAEAVRREARIGASYVARARQVIEAMRLTPSHVLDAARTELAILMTLGLGGFDSPDPARNQRELAEGVRGVRALFSAYLGEVPATDADTAVLRRLDAAVTLHEAAARRPDAAMDRFALLVHGLRPAALAVARWAGGRGIAPSPDLSLWRGRAATPYEVDALDPAAFAPPTARADTAVVTLGRALFQDPRLSGDGTRSCASCHVPERAFTDGLAVALGLPGRGRAAGGRPARNTPTVINAALQPAQLHDSRLVYLEDQVTDVVHDAAEMRGSLEVAAARLAADAAMAGRFARAFGRAATGGASAEPTVTGERIRLAIAAYVRSLVALDAPFDRAVRGDTAALGADAREGFNVFMGKARCGSCHFPPTFSGAVPPRYVRGETEVLGVPDAWPRFRRVDADSGRARVAGNPLHLHGFRTPALRNVALTAPYMHNGAMRTLEEVVAFYDRGGGAGLGLAVPHQTLPADRLRLTSGESRALVAFLTALTDTAGTTARR